MRVLALDPGPTKTAWLVWDDKAKQIAGKGIEPNEVVLGHFMGIEFDDFPDHEVMAIEMIESMGMAVGKEVFETVFWIGRFCQISIAEFNRVTRRAVKLHLCGQSRAKDANIRCALLDKIGPVGTKKNPGPCFGVSSHLWSALAVAVVFCETEGR